VGMDSRFRGNDRKITAYRLNVLILDVLRSIP